ncbi:addiction module protein [Hyalangium versicolor]|uniref:addiction module protein n=1 Tax=Hyalangium versicolor TaxID=2861190 RepID=UPI0035A0988A
MLSAMDDRARKLLEEALHLPAEERAYLAAELSASVEREESPGDLEKAWAEELEHRVHRVDSGESELTDWATVRARLQRAPGGR